MNNLIERLKKLEGPCRECDVLIHIAFAQHPDKSYSYGEDPHTKHYVGIFNEAGVHVGNNTPTPYTSSIDAARKLIRGRDVATIVIGGPSGGSCDIWDIWTDKENRWKGVHNSPAIATCIAAIQSHMA